jgi:hypothetical protein
MGALSISGKLGFGLTRNGSLAGSWRHHLRLATGCGEIGVFGSLAYGDTHALLLIPCDADQRDVEGCDYDGVEAMSKGPGEPGQIAQGQRRQR